jgi:hypothetical protein
MAPCAEAELGMRTTASSAVINATAPVTAILRHFLTELTSLSRYDESLINGSEALTRDGL